MTLVRGRRKARGIDYWPSFVDALSALLLALIFLFLVFLLAQVFLARDPAGRDAAMKRLDLEVEDLEARLEAERSAGAERLAAERSRLLARVAAAEKASAETAERASATFLAMTEELERAKTIAAAAEAKSAAAEAKATELEAAQAREHEREQEATAKVADLSWRLEAAQKGAALQHYRSEFFARLAEILGDRQDIRVAGDRFVVQSEVLFGSGRASLDLAGRAELDKIARALVELDSLIPKDVSWVLRVDGHTDKKPIVSRNFASNWALSSARATEVVRYLISKGVAPQRLAATGFGEFQPVDNGESEEADRRNRRIELKITER